MIHKLKFAEERTHFRIVSHDLHPWRRRFYVVRDKLIEAALIFGMVAGFWFAVYGGALVRELLK